MQLGIQLCFFLEGVCVLVIIDKMFLIEVVNFKVLSLLNIFLEVFGFFWLKCGCILFKGYYYGLYCEFFIFCRYLMLEIIFCCVQVRVKMDRYGLEVILYSQIK